MRKVPLVFIEIAVVLCFFAALAAYGSKARGQGELSVRSVIVAILFAAAAATGIVFNWRQARFDHAKGRCGTCGYDLRATPERCPECGAESRNANR